jgi:DNA/RNA endonuclease G (NUC1)
MPNDRSVPADDWGQYRVSVKDVEALTGYTFFDKVPAEIINPLKDKVDDESIPVLPRTH